MYRHSEVNNLSVWILPGRTTERRPAKIAGGERHDACRGLRQEKVDTSGLDGQLMELLAGF